MKPRSVGVSESTPTVNVPVQIWVRPLRFGAAQDVVAAAVTVAVSALVSVSVLSVASVKLTFTLRVLPTSAATGV